MKKVITYILIMLFAVCASGTCGCKVPIDEGKKGFVEFFNWDLALSVQPNDIMIDYDKKGVDCKVSCEKGILFVPGNHYSVQNAEITLPAVIHWAHWSHSEERIKEDYVTILLTEKLGVRGYALVKIELSENKMDYHPTLLAERVLETPISETEAKETLSRIQLGLEKGIVESARENCLVGLSTWFHSAGMDDHLIWINHEDENVRCKYYCQNGALILEKNGERKREIEVAANQAVMWTSVYEDPFHAAYTDNISVMLLKNDEVIGYAVIKVSKRGYGGEVVATVVNETMLETPISETEAWEIIDKIVR